MHSSQNLIPFVGKSKFGFMIVYYSGKIKKVGFTFLYQFGKIRKSDLQFCIFWKN